MSLQIMVPWRSNPALWAAPTAAALIIVGWATILGSAAFEPYLTGALARAGVGLQYGLPIVAAGSAWAARRSLALADPGHMRTLTRSAWRLWWAHVWPLFLGVAAGLAVTFAWSTAGDTLPGTFPWGVAWVFLVMTVASVSGGWILGRLLPVPIAVPVAAFLAVQWAVAPLASPAALSLRNVTGFATFMCCDFVEQALDPRAVLAPTLVALALCLVAVATIRLTLIRLALPGLAAVAVALLWAAGIADGSAATASMERSLAEQRCTGERPQICAYPETPDETREVLRAVWGSAAAAADAHGIAFAQTLQAPSAERVTDPGTLVVSVPAEATSDQAFTGFASSLLESAQCAAPAALPEETVVSYALAVFFGADPDRALPGFEVFALGEDGPESAARTIQGSEARQMLGVEGPEEATRIALAWFEAQAECEGTP